MHNNRPDEARTGPREKRRWSSFVATGLPGAGRGAPADRGHRNQAAAEGLLPGEGAVLPLAAHENFPVALRAARPRRRAAHLMAIYGFARLVDQLGDEVDGDRLALLDALEEDLDRVFDGEPRAPAAAAARADGARVRHAARAVPAADRGEPARPGAGRATRPSTSSSATATLSANPVGELVLHVFGAATPERIALSDRVCTGAAARRALAGRRRGLRGAAASTCPAEDLDAVRRRARRPRRGARRGAALRELMAFEVARARRAARRGRAARRHAARPRALRGRRLRRRRARERRRDRARRATTCSPGRRSAGRRAAAARRSSLEARPVTATRRARVRARAAAIARDVGLELLRRHAAAAARAARRALRDLRARAADRRHRRRRPAGRREARAARADRATSSARLDESDDPVLVAVADAARRYPIPLERVRRPRRRAPRWTCAAPSTRRSPSSSVYCRRVAGSIGRLALGVFDVLRPRARRDALADDLGVALQLGNILRDLARTCRNGRVYLPREDLERFGCEVARRADRGPGRAAGRVRGAARARAARPRARARAAARPPQRRRACSR